MDIFHQFVFIPIFNILIVLYRAFGENLGLSLIAIALISRLITIPITNRQIAAAEKNKEFQKKYNQLKKKYGKNKEKLNQELAKLQAEFLPGQLSGCLPLIIQLIMFIQIFNVLRDLFSRGAAAFNDIAYTFVPKFAEGYVINDKFLGIELGKTPAQIGTSDFGAFLPYLIIIILVMLTQYFSAKILAPQQDKKKVEDEKPGKKKKKEKEEPDMSDAMQMSSKQMQFIFPILIGVFSYNGAAGLGLYWTVQSGFVIIQGLFKEREKIIAQIKERFNKNKDGDSTKN